jgi:hypothetical protein
MPEIKNQFTGGKMNKDIDERLVPKGEYRDAMNIQVSTSEGSDVGTVQNILGNIEGCSWDMVPEGSFTVGSISDEKNDALYWLVSGEQAPIDLNSSSYDWSQFSHFSDMIVRKTTDRCEPVLVDKFAFTTSNNVNVNIGPVDQLSNLPADISSQIQPGWNVTGLKADGTLSNTAEISSITPSPDYTANLGVFNTYIANSLAVPLDAGGGMPANNNILYLVDYNPGVNLSDLAGLDIEIFDSSHPDHQTNTILSATAVNFTFVHVQPFPQAPFYSSVSYIKLTLSNPMDPISGNFGINYHQGGSFSSSSYQGAIIWGAIDTGMANIPIPNNVVNHTVPTTLFAGDPITFNNVNACIGEIINPNQFTLVDCSTGVPTLCPIGLFSFTSPLSTTINLDSTLNLSNGIPLHETLIFAKPRVLDFNHGDYVTGINIIDDMLFWTDGKTEPKKINIPRSIEGTKDFEFINSKFVYDHTRLMVEGVDKGPIKEEHITVIRKAPLKAPCLEMKSTEREGITSGDSVSTSYDFSDAIVGGLAELEFVFDPNSPITFKPGDIVLLAEDTENLPGDWQLRVSIKDVTYPSTYVLKLEVEIETLVAGSIPLSSAVWFGHLEQEKGLFERKLPRFAYRYRYEDGEYSSFSPFTEVAFLPGDFVYQPIEAYNKGLVNSVKSLKIQNFITPDMPLDVVSIDLLYKNETSPSVYLLKTITPNDIVLEGETENHWNSLGSSGMVEGSKGSYEISSENITLVLPSSQSIRVWDNVPKTALAQDITGNRVVYGNYTQGYDTIQPDIDAWLDSRAIDASSNIGEKSIKSLRDYDIGIVWGDKYGRETPVKTSGLAGSINVPKSRSISSNYINVNLKDSPDWAEYYRIYVKETSNEYYNLAVDRIYDAADGNIWVSFPSVDRNKVDEDTYIVLKKGVESDELINEEARYKIVAIENEAPEYIKTTYERLARTNTDDSRAQYSCNMFAGINPCDGTVGYPGGGRNAPIVGMKGFSLAAGHWMRDYGTIHDPGNGLYLGMQLTSPKVLFDEVVQNSSGSTTDELYVSFSKEVDDIPPRISHKYHVVNVSDTETIITDDDGNDISGFFYINLDTPILSDDEWVTEYTFSGYPDGKDNIHIHFWKKTIINKPEFDGRFFVKILGDSTTNNQLQVKREVDGNLMVVAATSLYKIEDAKYDSLFATSASEPYAYNNTSSATTPAAGLDTIREDMWNQKLKFGGSSPTSHWFIDKATFASLQGSVNQTLPSSGKLDYTDITTLFYNSAGDPFRSCDTLSSNSLKYKASCWSVFEQSTFTKSTTKTSSVSIGDGESNGAVAMKGAHIGSGGDTYIDISYSQLGPTGNVASSSNKTKDHKLDWRVGDNDNTSSDEELLVVSNLKNNTRFRLAGSDVVYIIKGVTKYRLFNYQGEMTVTRDGNVIDFDYPPSWTGWDNVTREWYKEVCGNFWSQDYYSQTALMADKRNRRLTYRIRYEVDPVFTPSDSVVDAIDYAGEPYHNITNTTANALEFLTDFRVDGENPISADPAIFETEPKEDVDIDIYYEASSSLPTLPITDKNKHLYIPIGSTIIPPAGTGFPEGVFITSWEPINPFSPIYNINLSTQLDVTTDYNALDSTPIVYVEKDNGEIASFKVLNKVVDPSSGMVKGLIITPKNEVGLNWFNCWSFNNGVESNRIGDTYNKPYITNGVTVSSSTEELKEEEIRKNGLIYSGIYNSTSGVNNLNQFIAGEKITKDISPIYGSIQKLHAGWGQGGDLVALCEDRILKILANKDALYNADGNSNVTSTNNVLGQAIPYSGEYGISKNPESFASEAYRAYFTDRVRGTVMRLSMDGLTPISNYGMKDWFRDNLRLNSKIIGSYDDKKDEYNVTLKRVFGGELSKIYPNPPRGVDFDYDELWEIVTQLENDEAMLSTAEGALLRSALTSKTVTFREDVKGWVSFKSFVPENAVSCANEYYTFKEGKLWRHHSTTNAGKGAGTYNTFYGIHNSKDYSTITTILNDAPGSIKSFNTINYEGSDSKVVSNLTDDQYYNLYEKPGWYVDRLITNKETGSLDEFIEKEGKWFNYIKGESVQHSGNNIILNFDGSSTFDHASFAIQGIGMSLDNPIDVAIQGCTDPYAFNYDPYADTDDGSCESYAYGCLHPSADNYDSNANTDSGDCVWVGCTCDPYSYPDGCTNTTLFPYEAVNYPITPITTDAAFEAWLHEGQTVLYPINATPPANSTQVEFSGVNDDGSCIEIIPGCTDITASNYNSLANTPDGSCIAATNGCTFPTATNYDNSVTTDNGTCIWLGCLDPNANNYYYTTETWANDADNYSPANSSYGLQDALASCTYDLGCTDSLALNYDSTATMDDDNCNYCDWPSNPIDIISIVITQDETVADAGDGTVKLVLNPSFTDYGFNSTTSLSTINIVDSSGSVTPLSLSHDGTNYYVVSGSLDDGDYDVYLEQGSDSYVGNQIDPCIYNYGSVTIAAGPPAPVPGCTDSDANNYDASATADDGSCTYTVYGCTDEDACNTYGTVPANTTLIDDPDSCGYCCLWPVDEFGALDPSQTFTWTSTDETVAGANDGTVTVTINSSFTDYGFDSTTDGATVVVFTDPGGSALSGSQTLSFDGTNYYATITGLTPDPNYTPLLIQGSGSFVTNQTSACDMAYLSEHISINAGPTSVGGCTDSAATNYDATATSDDGSCIYASGTFLEGDSAFGGIIGYIFIAGDSGYVAGEDHGIIVQAADTLGVSIWGDPYTSIANLSTQIGEGKDNTATIMAHSTNTSGTAASLTDSYTDGTYTDWFLPSQVELLKFYNRIGPGATGMNSNGDSNNNIANFYQSNHLYWSSSQTNSTHVWVVNLTTGVASNATKTSTLPFRATRYF